MRNYIWRIVAILLAVLIVAGAMIIKSANTLLPKIYWLMGSMSQENVNLMLAAILGGAFVGALLKLLNMALKRSWIDQVGMFLILACLFGLVTVVFGVGPMNRLADYKGWTGTERFWFTGLVPTIIVGALGAFTVISTLFRQKPISPLFGMAAVFFLSSYMNLHDEQTHGKLTRDPLVGQNIAVGFGWVTGSPLPTDAHPIGREEACIYHGGTETVVPYNAKDPVLAEWGYAVNWCLSQGTLANLQDRPEQFEACWLAYALDKQCKAERQNFKLHGKPMTGVCVDTLKEALPPMQRGANRPGAARTSGSRGAQQSNDGLLKSYVPFTGPTTRAIVREVGAGEKRDFGKYLHTDQTRLMGAVCPAIGDNPGVELWFRWGSNGLTPLGKFSPGSVFEIRFGSGIQFTSDGPQRLKIVDRADSWGVVVVVPDATIPRGFNALDYCPNGRLYAEADS